MLDHVISGQKYGPYGTIKLSMGFPIPPCSEKPWAMKLAASICPPARQTMQTICKWDSDRCLYKRSDLDDYFGECNFGTGDLTGSKESEINLRFGASGPTSVQTPVPILPNMN